MLLVPIAFCVNWYQN